MPNYTIDLRRPAKRIYSIPLVNPELCPEGDSISFTNYYMQRQGQPLFGVCGEFHYARYPRAEWDAELLKMKLGGVNIVSSYVFWIHHEEIQGQFRWDGDRDLRAFVELCARHGLLFIARVGPFCHGECRNGGLPDWLYGRTMELRSNDPAYLALVGRLYGEIGQQLRGLFFQNGGPIVAVQLENEFMHASAPWEMVPRQAHEWAPSGSGGAAHLRELRRLAEDHGLIAPFYTSTGWGGAPVLEGEVLPLYGGYAFCPWNVDEHRPTHLPTAEYLFRSYHENGASWGAEPPPYAPEEYPFACCEMGGGMQVWYKHRFVVPPVSVEAMALMKIAGGCNFVGYYMYHGGSNPLGERGYLNEHVTPKISYDFQAPLGEFGQVRDSYRALRLVHRFASDFAAQLCPAATVLPPSNAAITPEDTATLRFAARAADGAGFLFLNSYQDHVEMADLHDLHIEVALDGETLALPRAGGLTLRRNTCAILPINLDMGGARLRYATAQPVARLAHEGEQIYVFFAPDGMACEYCLDGAGVAAIAADAGEIEREDGRIYVAVTPGTAAQVCIQTSAGAAVRILTLTRRQALGMTKLELWGGERLLLSDADLMFDGDTLTLERDGEHDLSFSLFPAVVGPICGPGGELEREADGLFTRYRVALPARAPQVALAHASDRAATLSISPDALDGLADVTLHIRYRGDVGYASVDGRLLSDNFANGADWEIGLRRFADVLLGGTLELYISPLREGSTVFSDSAMAVKQEFIGRQIAQIEAVTAVPRYRAALKLG